ncbi:MAG: ATP-dependent DNA helicase [Chitinophagaceae bacterium]
MQTFEERYVKRYEKLNNEQKEAVDTIYGPVMVLAGPGTGKTEILAMRIANLLRSEAQILPQNILCLTFTDEGKKNMNERLIRIIGIESASKIAVHTFHSFCNEIINQFPSWFKKNEVDLISDLEHIQLLSEILHELPIEHPLHNPKYVDSEIKSLKSAFERIKLENWDSREVLNKIDEYIKELSEDPQNISSRGPTKGNLKADILEKLNRLEKLKKRVALFEIYDNKMNQINRFEYSDMINWVIRLFETDESILSYMHEKYQYLLVDEFQDTNGSQLAIINLLSAYDASPNLFIVGDDDQSIYRFQGANIENLISFRKQYKDFGLKEICLKINYRSYQGILDEAALLIKRNNNRMINFMPHLDKNLLSESTNSTKQNSQLKLCSFHTPRYEKVFIAQEIKKLIAQGVPMDEIAVLYTKNVDLIELTEYLKKLDIPFYAKKESDLLKHILIKQLVTIMTYVQRETQVPYSGDEDLFHILHFNFFGIDPIEIAKASITASTYRKNQKSNSSFRAYLQELIQHEKPLLFLEKASDKLVATAAILENLIQASANLSLLQWFDFMIESCSVIPTILSNPIEKFTHFEALTSFSDYIKKTCQGHKDMELHDFVQGLTILENNKLEIPLINVYGSDKAVKLFTYHGSKGREFEYVFLGGCVAKEWESKKGNSNTTKFPPNLFGHIQDDKDEEELRRLLYVGITRAKKQVYLSYYEKDLDGKDIEKSRFIHEILGDEPDIIKPELSRENLILFETALNIDTTTEALQLEKAYVDRQLENFTMNVTSLNQYLECPIKFYYNKIVSIPSGVSENMTFGSAMHYVLEKAFEEMKEQKQDHIATERLDAILYYFMQKNKEKFSKNGYGKLSEYGKYINQILNNNLIPESSKNVDLEMKINVLMDGIPLTGKIDKIEKLESGDIVVDYKTGNYNSPYTKDKLKAPKEDKIGGDYWRQSVFYKILLDKQQPRKYKNIGTRFDFLEPDKETNLLPPSFVFNVSDNDIEIVKKEIKDVWEKIQQHDFYTGCDKKECTWCNMAKTVTSK